MFFLQLYLFLWINSQKSEKIFFLSITQFLFLTIFSTFNLSHFFLLQGCLELQQCIGVSLVFIKVVKQGVPAGCLILCYVVWSCVLVHACICIWLLTTNVQSRSDGANWETKRLRSFSVDKWQIQDSTWGLFYSKVLELCLPHESTPYCCDVFAGLPHLLSAFRSYLPFFFRISLVLGVLPVYLNYKSQGS